MVEADVVIVGAGSAGCTLAGRLSEAEELHVTLIEAGTPSHYPWLDIPIGYFKTVGNPRFDWRFETEPEPALNGRQLPCPRGKGLGGSSLINGMLYLRGHRADYDQWATLGNPGWDWESVRPYFDRSVNSDRESGTSTGGAGPLSVTDLPHDPLSDAFIEAARHCGIASTTDFNSGDNSGAGYFKLNTRRGRRVSTARAFLDPVRDRANLEVVTGAHATRVLLERGRAVGAEIVRNGVKECVRARHEVILCAGAIQSPQLLQISGIGSPNLLARHGISVAADLSGVGQNLQDHLQTRLIYRCTGVETLNDIAHSTLRSAREFLRYLFARTGTLNNGVYRAGAFFSLREKTGWPDVQIHFGLVSFDRPHQPPHKFSGITLSACQLRPESRGRVEIASSDPLAAPRIHTDYLKSAGDRQLVVAMSRQMREIAAAPSLVRYIQSEHEPGAGIQTDSDVLEWVRRRACSVFHPVGTCAMGPDDDRSAVVDARLRVRGIRGLRVVDGSIMPRIVSGNTNAPIIMIAERASQLICDDLRA